MVVVSSRALLGQRALLLLAMMTMMILTTTTVDAVGTQLDDHPKYRKGIGTIVEDSYIVVLRPDPFLEGLRSSADLSALTPVDTAQEATSLVPANDGNVLDVYDWAMRGFSFRMQSNLTQSSKDGVLERILNNEDVLYMEEVQILYRQDSDTDNTCPASWGLDRIDQLDLPLNGHYLYHSFGSGVDVYILDTGIRVTHEQFDQDRAQCGASFVWGDDDPCNDPHGHGTHVAGTVAGKDFGVAKAAHVIAVKVLGSDGSGRTDDIVDAIDWVARQAYANRDTRRSVMNLSLGGRGYSRAFDEAIFFAKTDSNVVSVVAAGNANQNACSFSPAFSDNAITVGSTDPDDSRSGFSNFGNCVDLFAPGRDIASAWSTSDTATRVISGTSMASPHIAGLAALYWQENPFLTAVELEDRLLTTAAQGVVTDAQSRFNNLGSSAASLTGYPEPDAQECSYPGPSSDARPPPRIQHGGVALHLAMASAVCAILLLGMETTLWLV